MKPGREVIEVNLEEWQALLERARQEPLDEESYEKLQAALRAFRLSDGLDWREGYDDQPAAGRVGKTEHGEDE